MLVVITIIGILAGLTIPAVMVVMRRAKVAGIVLDLNNLDSACKAYKEKFGEYPPDFTYVTAVAVAELYTAHQSPAKLAAQQLVLRHLAKAFPRYQPGISSPPATPLTGWAGFIADLTNAGVLPSGATDPQIADQLNPQTALAFWLGGIADPTTGVPTGFAADPTNPFQTTAQCASRIGPLFDFDPTRLKNVTTVAITRNWAYWPQGALGDKTTGAITYFRAENGTYTVSYVVPNLGTFYYVKATKDAGDATKPHICAANDTRINTTTPPFVNPKSIQIFSSGMDTKYGDVGAASGVQSGSPASVIGLQFPTGDNYQPSTYDDVTNFTTGTLEDAVP
jgi:type II secretory pathway pseudopilin PulG